MNADVRKYLDLLESGAIDLDDPSLIEAANRLPELAQELEELTLVRQMLGEQVGAEAEVIAAAKIAAAQSGDRERVESVVGLGSASPKVEAADRAGSGSSHARRWGRWLPLAASAILAFGGWALWRSNQAPAPYDPGPALGGSLQIELLRPQGPNGDWSEFAWRGPEPGLWYIVHVIDLDTGEEFHSGERTEATWDSDLPETVKRIEWWVQCFRSSSNNSFESARLRASR